MNKEISKRSPASATEAGSETSKKVSGELTEEELGTISGGGKANISEIQITKVVDKSSTKLF